MLQWMLLVLFLAQLTAPAEAQGNDDNEQQCQQDLAKLFGTELVPVHLSFAKKFQHFRIKNWHYLAHQYGRYLVGPIVKETLPCHIIPIGSPLQRTISLSSAHLPFFEQLNLADRLIGLSKVGSVHSIKIQQRWQQRKIRDVGYPPPNEMLLALNPDSVLLFYAPLFLQELEKFGLLSAPRIVILEHEETHPLARIEWIKFFGILYGVWEQAVGQYNKIESEYLTWSQRARFSAKLPKVLVGNLSPQKWWDAPGGNSYLAHLIADAGGDYLFEQYQSPQIAKLNFEQVQQLSKNAVVWITLSSWASKQELLAADAHYFHLNAFQENRIFNFSIAAHLGLGQVSWEDALGRPDEILKDLIFIFHPEYLIDRTFYWARKIN